MLNRHLNSLSLKGVKSLHKQTMKAITSSDIIRENPEVTGKLKYDPIKEPEKFKKEYLTTHWLTKYTEGIKLWFLAPFRLKIWNTEKDTDSFKTLLLLISSSLILITDSQWL